MSLSDKILNVKKPPAPRKEPLWKGPEEDGITFSLLSRFLVCRERFRLLVVEGLRPADSFDHKIEFGQMWHVCEESLAKQDRSEKRSPIYIWPAALQDYAKGLCQRYQMSQEQIDHWYNVVKVTFPLYVEWWAKHPDVQNRTPLLQEQVFDVPYSLPSGRTVRLRGKWDSVDLIQEGKTSGVFLQENKTKGDIREGQIQRQMAFDLQTQLYLVALHEHLKDPTGLGFPGMPLRGVRYNVIRRPLSGGKGSIVRHKPTKSNPTGESKKDYYARLAGIISDSPGDFFMRWRVEVTPDEIQRFRQQCLDPILEQLCDWWGWVSTCTKDGKNVWDNDVSQIYPWYGPEESHPSSVHWRHPHGVYNVLDEGGASDLDEYLMTGNETGLQRVERLFVELEP